MAHAHENHGQPEHIPLFHMPLWVHAYEWVAAVPLLVGMAYLSIRLLPKLFDKRKTTIPDVKWPVAFSYLSVFLVPISISFGIIRNIQPDNPPSYTACRLSWSLNGILYSFSKLNMYLYFVGRLKSAFHRSTWEFSERGLNTIRVVVSILTLIWTVLFISFLFEEFDECRSPIWVSACVVFNDSCISAFCVWLLNRTLVKVIASQSVNQHAGTSTNIEEIVDRPSRTDGLLHMAAKQVILAATAALSTFFFTFVMGFVVTDLIGIFAAVDVFINSLCIYLTFKYYDDTYKCLCSCSEKRLLEHYEGRVVEKALKIHNKTSERRNTIDVQLAQNMPRDSESNVPEGTRHV